MALNSTRVKSLLLTLVLPTKLFVSWEDLPDSPLRLAELVSTRPSFPPWAACADILFNAQSRIFVGLSYPVGSEDEHLVRGVCSSVPNQVMRYNDFTIESLRKPYEANDDFDIDRLEIVWTDLDADAFETAQLDSGFWYYSERGNRVIAFGLTDIDDILDDYDLTLPESFHFPQFVPEFVPY